MKAKILKSLSLALTLIMLLSAIPFTASAADPIELKKANVELIPPTANPSVAPYGTTYNDIELIGGTLWHVADDGTKTLVPGHFIWSSAGTNPINVGGPYTPGIKFVPDDQTAYSISGRLSTTATIVSGEWPSVTITGIPTPRIKTAPTVKVVMGVDKTYADAKITGGTAVDKDTQTVVAGTFVIADDYKDMAIEQFKRIKVRFIPNDLESYTDTAIAEVLPKYTKPVKFVDSEGNEIVPEIELGYNTEDLKYNLGEIKALLAPYANCGADKFYCNWQDLDNKDLEHADDYLEINTTKEYTIRGLSYDSDNYAPAMLTFKLKVVPRKLTATVRYSGNAIKVQTTKPLTDKLYGTFEYYANGEKIGTSQITKTDNATSLGWKPEKSGVYDITVKFVPDEKDVYYFDDTTVEDMEIICAWGVTVENGTVKVSNSYKDSGSFKYGEDVRVQTNSNAAFSHWIVTDAKGNEIDIEGFDKNVSYNTFKMPDFNVHFKAIDLEQRRINCTNCFVKNAVGTADAPIRYKGQKVSIGIDEAALPLEKFAGWEITDANGNAYLPEGMTEEALMNTNLEFTMPDFDINVKAKNVDDQKGEGFFAQVKAFFENLFGGFGEGTSECPVLNWLKNVIEIIVTFFTDLFNGMAC